MDKNETHTTHRELEVLQTLRALGGSARTTALAAALQVSEETIRRTVKALAKSDLVQRVHGGVYLSSQDANAPMQSRLQSNAGEKMRIAQTCANLVEDGTTLFLDVGSTTAYVAERLKDHQRLTVVTNGIPAALALSGQNQSRIFLAGGEVRPKEQGTIGLDVCRFVEQFRIDTAVMSVDAIDVESGFLLTGVEESEIARTVTRIARQVIVVADSRKFGQSAPLVAFPAHNVDVLITGGPLPAPFPDRMLEWGIEVVVPEPAADLLQIGT